MSIWQKNDLGNYAKRLTIWTGRGKQARSISTDYKQQCTEINRPLSWNKRCNYSYGSLIITSLLY